MSWTRRSLGQPQRFLERLIGELTQRYRYVLLDVGPEGLHRQPRSARAGVALGRMRSDSWRERLGLVVNRHWSMGFLCFLSAGAIFLAILAARFIR